MDTALIAEKLESLRRCVIRIEQKCPPTIEQLSGDPDVQDIVALNLQRAVQICVDIAAHVISESGAPAPLTMGDAFDTLAGMAVISSALALRLRKAVGFRNIAVHSYSTIDWAIVHAVCRHGLTDFRDFASAIAGRLS